MEWRFADARNRFRELVKRALSEGPQRVRRHRDTVVVVAERDYKKLTASRQDFKRFLLERGPSLDGVEIERDTSSMRM